jgi:hypothetical protein
VIGKTFPRASRCFWEAQGESVSLHPATPKRGIRKQLARNSVINAVGPAKSAGEQVPLNLASNSAIGDEGRVAPQQFGHGLRAGRPQLVRRPAIGAKVSSKLASRFTWNFSLETV